MKLAALTLPLALLAVVPATAETVADSQVWLNATAMGSIKDRLIYFAEVQPRFIDGSSRVGTLYLRGAVGWQVSKSLSIYQGYLHAFNPIEHGPDTNEERMFQQISWTIGKIGRGSLSSRTRFEERWRSDGDGMAFRVREMIRYAHPLRADNKGPNALVYFEGFAALNETKWGVKSGFDQLRSFGGLEIPVGGKATLEAGYLNQRVNQTRGRIADNHVASLTLFFRH